jgi:hypothetical protein
MYANKNRYTLERKRERKRKEKKEGKRERRKEGFLDL